MNEARAARFGQTLAALDAEIDWDVIAGVVCDGESEGFFDDERREAVLDAGLKLAADVGDALGKAGVYGKSLYVGAAVAELAPIMFEAIMLGRKVVWVNLPSPESEELCRAIAAVDGELPTPRTDPWDGRAVGPVTHIWMTSVLTDPEVFPALHNELYRRQGTKEAVRGGRPKAERRAARELVDNCLLAVARERTLLTTTAEELEVWAAAAEEFGLRLDVDRKGRLSGLVGDVVHHGWLRDHG